MSILVIILIIAVAAAFYFMKRPKNEPENRTSVTAPTADSKSAVSPSQPVKTANVNRSEDSVAAPKTTAKTVKSAQTESRVEKPQKEVPKKNYGRDLYNYINQSVRCLHICNVEDNWDSIDNLGTISDNLYNNYQEIRRNLSEKNRQLLDKAAACLEIIEADGVHQAGIRDKEGLKELFYQTMLPFYEQYAKVLGDGRVKHSSLIGQDMLNLFHQLTGRKFRVGYHNRYNSGVTAFEKNGESYKVFDKEGTLLCDATFKDRRIENGFALSPNKELSDGEWTVYEAGNYKNGVFTGGVMHYHYNVECL